MKQRIFTPLLPNFDLSGFSFARAVKGLYEQKPDGLATELSTELSRITGVPALGGLLVPTFLMGLSTTGNSSGEYTVGQTVWPEIVPSPRSRAESGGGFRFSDRPE